MLWDSLHQAGQVDLQVSAAHRSVVEEKLTEELKRGIQREVADPAKRRDARNCLLLDGFKKIHVHTDRGSRTWPS